MRLLWGRVAPPGHSRNLEPAERAAKLSRAAPVVPAPVGHDHLLGFPSEHPLEEYASLVLGGPRRSAVGEGARPAEALRAGLGREACGPASRASKPVLGVPQRWSAVSFFRNIPVYPFTRRKRKRRRRGANPEEGPSLRRVFERPDSRLWVRHGKGQRCPEGRSADCGRWCRKSRSERPQAPTRPQGPLASVSAVSKAPDGGLHCY